MAPTKTSAKKPKAAPASARVVGGYALLAIAAALIAIALFLPGDKLMSTLQLMLKPSHVASKPVTEVQVEKDASAHTVPDVAAKSKESTTVSAYDEYVAMSKVKGWSPTDPVLKLESTIRKYSHVFDVLDKKSLENSAVLKQYLDMMGQEVKHLLKVLCRSTDRTIDLTPSLHLALDSIQEVVYRLLKLYLGSNKMVYRSAITGNLNHWMYSPLQELTKVAAQKYPHLRINFNSRSGETAGDDKDRTSALEKATKRGLYNLLPMLLIFGADAHSVVEALRISIRHGDDTALALLLTSIVDPSASGTAGAPHLVPIRSALVQELPVLVELAQDLRFEHVLQRLQLVQRMINAPTPEEGAALLSQLKGLERHNDYPASSFDAATCSTINTVPVDLTPVPTPPHTDSPSGYHRFQIVDVFGTLPSPTGTAEGINRCVIDRVDISNITVEQFFQKCVVRNQPVVFTSAAWDAAAVADGWDLQALLDKFGDIKEVAGAIPYATLFGHTEEVTTLKEFVDTVMRPHTARMVLQFATDASSSAASEAATSTNADAVETGDAAARKVCRINQASEEHVPGLSTFLVNEEYLTGLDGAVPGYIFSGVQQNLNKAVRKQMVQSVLAFSQPSLPVTAVKTSTATTNSPVTRLMDLMHSVSADFPGFSTKDGEPARRVKHKTNFKPHWKSQFYLGPPLSGAPFHHHGPAFNMLIYGRKEWTIMPPARDVYSSAHPVTWLQDGGLQAAYYPYSNQHGSGTNQQQHPGDQPCKIVQNPGEVIFVPRHWTHQVLNLAESVGFAVEIDDYVH